MEYEELSEGVSLNRNFAEMFDWNTLLTAVLLTTIGLLSIYSATFDAGMSNYFNKQLIFAGIGFGVMMVIAFLPERWIGLGAYGFYAFNLLLLIAVVIIGHTVYGSKSWIVLGPLSFQPSETAKIATLLAMARFISRPNVDLKTIRDLGIVMIILAVPSALMMLEPDFGSTTVFVAMTLGVILWCGADLFMLFTIVALPIVVLIAFFGKTPFYVAAILSTLAAFSFRKNIILTVVVSALIVGAGFSTTIVYSVMKPHQKSRIQTFLDPNTDPKGKGYHVLQSTMAVGSGGLFGKGFLHGTQTQLRYIPKQWTDFIYCVPTEEFGFLGGSSVIVLLTFLSLRAIKTASSVKTKFPSAVSAGIASVWMYHTLINIGMAVGLMPVMGIPLPFLSAGGSSLVVNLMMVGLILNFHRNRRDRSVSA